MLLHIYSTLTLLSGAAMYLAACQVEDCRISWGRFTSKDFAMISTSSNENLKRVPTSISLETIAIGAWGVVNLGFGVTLLLLLNLRENNPTHAIRVIGWGHLPVLFYLIRNYISGRFAKAGFDTSHLFWLVSATAIGTANMIMGLWNPQSNAMALPLVLGIVSTMFYVHPKLAAKAILGQDLSHNTYAQALVCAEHQYLLLHSLLNILVVSNVEVQAAIGWTALVHACTTMEVTYHRQQHHTNLGIPASIPIIITGLAGLASLLSF